jgi:hypothetical protein
VEVRRDQRGSFLPCGEDIAYKDFLDILWLETGTLNSSCIIMLAFAPVGDFKMNRTYP